MVTLLDTITGWPWRRLVNVLCSLTGRSSSFFSAVCLAIATISLAFTTWLYLMVGMIFTDVISFLLCFFMFWMTVKVIGMMIQLKRSQEKLMEGVPVLPAFIAHQQSRVSVFWGVIALCIWSLDYGYIPLWLVGSLFCPIGQYFAMERRGPGKSVLRRAREWLSTRTIKLPTWAPVPAPRPI